MGMLIYARSWWARRGIKKASSGFADDKPKDIMNVQYTVVKERNVDDQAS